MIFSSKEPKNGNNKRKESSRSIKRFLINAQVNLTEHKKVSTVTLSQTSKTLFQVGDKTFP